MHQVFGVSTPPSCMRVRWMYAHDVYLYVIEQKKKKKQTTIECTRRFRVG